MKVYLFIFPNLHKINIFEIYTITHKYIKEHSCKEKQ